ncbi:hypothetical protein B0A50_04480 [Salinomyces thailandicus]|uniref:Galactose oxidase n=1 Tax=Salinomyces thailandicus TaxID=706561 RepID=A0A4U0TXF5_9PEZI|nr:hypothetical protein B0A50_04480 [Salinomyces thailandica]
MRARTTALASLLALLDVAISQTLPYNPTRVLLSPNASHAYVFRPLAQNKGQTELSAISLRDTISSSANSFKTITGALPFLQDGEQGPYTPTMGPDGNITVVAGDCSEGAQGANVWRFVPNAHSSSGDGTWTQYQTSVEVTGSERAVAGPNYLAGGVTFSRYQKANATNTDIFIFGGMCPFENSTTETWNTAANYSDQMLIMSAAEQAGKTDYDISLAASNGPPIAEAGFTITPLAPTYSLNSAGEVQTQQQDFVLLGGQTQSAFINMSQVALYSLPQESWTFLPVAQPGNAKTDLAARQTATEVEPRSGHTAVLSEDGSSVIMFGGWVGGVETPAQPQLAVLEFASGYGGSGDWTWNAISTSDSPLAPGEGVYGHGAAMLPGGIMMVVGGHPIASSSGTRSKRETSADGTQIWLYNTTSKQWIDSYDPPVLNAPAANSADSGSSHAQAVGLGTGLGIGGAFLVALVAFYFWYSKRVKRARENRGQALLSRSSNGSFIGTQLDHPFLNDSGIDGHGGDAVGMSRFWNAWDHGNGGYSAHEPQMEQDVDAAGATGLFMNVPSPTRGLRKGVPGKNYQYHAAPQYNEQRTGRVIGSIHPIAEREDEDDSLTGREEETLAQAQRRLRAIELALAIEDPFADQEPPNPLGSHPPSPEHGGEDTVGRVPSVASRVSAMPSRQPTVMKTETPNWSTMEDDPTAYPLHVDTGRASPTKTDERTASTLSDMSRRSTSLTRTMSTRTGAILQAALAARAASNSSPEHSWSSEGRALSTSGGRKSPLYYHTRGRSSTAGSGAPNSAGADAESFTTAKTTFIDLQSQGEALLGGRPMADRDDPYQRAMAAHGGTRDFVPPMPTSNVPRPAPPRRRQGWMGSIRRALNVVSIGERSFSMTSNGEQASSTSSPTKQRTHIPIGMAPRRAASDGGALLRQKRGEKDWADGNQWPRYRDDPDPGDWGHPARSSLEEQQAEEDWDVEDAANKRDVQVMFTIPKSRLRVVNATDTDKLSLRSASEGHISRSGSTRSGQGLRHEGSVRTLRARSEGEKGLLPSTEEEGDASMESGPFWDEKEKAS